MRSIGCRLYDRGSNWIAQRVASKENEDLVALINGCIRHEAAPLGQVTEWALNTVTAVAEQNSKRSGIRFVHGQSLSSAGDHLFTASSEETLCRADGNREMLDELI